MMKKREHECIMSGMCSCKSATKLTSKHNYGFRNRVQFYSKIAYTTELKGLNMPNGCANFNCHWMPIPLAPRPIQSVSFLLNTYGVNIFTVVHDGPILFDRYQKKWARAALLNVNISFQIIDMHWNLRKVEHKLVASQKPLRFADNIVSIVFRAINQR